MKCNQKKRESANAEKLVIQLFNIKQRQFLCSHLIRLFIVESVFISFICCRDWKFSNLQPQLFGAFVYFHFIHSMQLFKNGHILYCVYTFHNSLFCGEYTIQKVDIKHIVFSAHFIRIFFNPFYIKRRVYKALMCPAICHTFCHFSLLTRFFIAFQTPFLSSANLRFMVVSFAPIILGAVLAATPSNFAHLLR